MANRSAIFSSNVPGGPQNIVDFAKHPYDVYFIDSSNSNASDAAGYGNSPDIPLASIDYLFSLATAGKKVVGYVLPGHTETYSTTGTKMTADKAGVHIIGLGKGSNRPTITFSHVDATWVISAANITIENILFVAGIDSVVTYGTISGNDFTMINCEWRDTTDIEVISDWTITGDRAKFINCYKNGYTGGDANARVLSLNGTDGVFIHNCRFITNVTVAVINFVTTLSTNVIINGCTFLTGVTDYSDNVVDTIGSSTWLVTKGYDIGAGAKFSGGSGGALAGDDVGAVAAAVAVIDGIVDNILIDTGTTIPAQITALFPDIVTKSVASIANGNTNLFSVIGEVEIETIYGVITTGTQDSACTYKFDFTDGVTDTDFCTTTSIQDKAAGTNLTISGTVANALEVTAGNFGQGQARKINLSGEGTGYIRGVASAAITGEITFYCKYKKLSSDGAITAVA